MGGRDQVTWPQAKGRQQPQGPKVCKAPPRAFGERDSTGTRVWLPDLPNCQGTRFCQFKPLRLWHEVTAAQDAKARLRDAINRGEWFQVPSNNKMQNVPKTLQIVSTSPFLPGSGLEAHLAHASRHPKSGARCVERWESISRPCLGLR